VRSRFVKGTSLRSYPKAQSGVQKGTKKTKDFGTRFCGRGLVYRTLERALAYITPAAEMRVVRLNWAGDTFDLPDPVCDVELEPRAAWIRSALCRLCRRDLFAWSAAQGSQAFAPLPPGFGVQRTDFAVGAEFHPRAHLKGEHDPLDL